VQQLTTEPARPLDTAGMPWIPTGPGKSFRPLRFTEDGWSELMRLEPGSVVALHRHTGELHVYEPAGTVDTWLPRSCPRPASAPSTWTGASAKASSPTRGSLAEPLLTQEGFR
jgi:hypothetical protein